MQSFDVKNLFFRFAGIANCKWFEDKKKTRKNLENDDDVFRIIFSLAGISFIAAPAAEMTFTYALILFSQCIYSR